jgi:outer membrane immunogenic protein
MHFKTYLLSTASALAVAGAVSLNPAYAADIPARMPVKAPVVEAPFSWSGFYIGIHGGGARLDHRQITFDGNGACGAPFGTTSVCDLDKFGGAFGGLAGFNMQSGQFVYGIEVDGSWLGTKVSATYPDIIGFPGAAPVTLNGKVEWLATVRGRVGMALSPTLIYVTGGVAFGGVKSSWAVNVPPPCTGTDVICGVAVDKTKTGWVVGGGIEHAFARNWSLRLEALYHDLGKITGPSFTESGFTYSTTFRHRVTTARAALALRW